MLALLCRGEDELHPDSSASLSLWARMLDRLIPGLGTLAQGSRRYRAHLELRVAATRPHRGSTHLLAIAPASSAGVAGLCTDPGALARAVGMGDASATAAINHLTDLDLAKTPIPE